MTDRELMRMALLALDLWKDALTDPCADHAMRYRSFGENSAKALRERLSQPEHEPVAWMDSDGEIKVRLDMAGKLYYSETNVYAAPPKREWVGLTEYQRLRFADRYHIPLKAVEAIEAKLKEKNT